MVSDVLKLVVIITFMAVSLSLLFPMAGIWFVQNKMNSMMGDFQKEILSNSDDKFDNQSSFEKVRRNMMKFKNHSRF